MRILPAFAALAVLAIGTSALAHPKLVSAVPAVNGVVTGSPTAIRMTFSEAPFPKLSGVKLTDAAGKAIRTGAPSISPTEKMQLVVPVTSPLAPGAYKVAWFAVAGDTHRVSGKFSFTVK